MFKHRRWFSSVAILGALVLVIAACGSDPELATGHSNGVEDNEVLPTIDPNLEPPPTESPCLVDEPDCEDTLDPAPGSADLPDTSDNSTFSDTKNGLNSAMPANGGLSIAEALDSDAVGVVAVTGHLFDDGTGLGLCESLVGLGERYGCDGERIPVLGLDPNEVPDIIFFEGTVYTEEEIILFGELIDGALVVDSSVSG